MLGLSLMTVPMSRVVIALINLDTPAHYIRWHFFKMSVANAAVIALMIAVFVAAMLIPFPGKEDVDG